MREQCDLGKVGRLSAYRAPVQTSKLHPHQDHRLVCSGITIEHSPIPTKYEGSSLAVSFRLGGEGTQKTRAALRK